MNIFDGKISGFLLPPPHKKSSYPLPHPPFFDHNRENIPRKQTKRVIPISFPRSSSAPRPLGKGEAHFHGGIIWESHVSALSTLAWIQIL